VCPICYGDNDRFPEGESIKDLTERAKIALTKFVLPHVWQAAKEGQTGIHVAIVSHESLERRAKQGRRTDYSHLSNTGWTRVVIDIEVGSRETWWSVS